MTQTPLHIAIPDCDVKEYARLTGQSEHVVRKHVSSGLIPSFKRGKRRLINMAKLYHDNANA